MRNQFADMINWNDKSLCEAIFYIEAQTYRDRAPRGELCRKGWMHPEQVRIAHNRLQKMIRGENPSRDAQKYFALLNECQRRGLLVKNK